MRARALTRRQAEILGYIRGFMADTGYAPSHEEIAAAFGLSSVATVHEHIENLVRIGALVKWPRAHRGLAFPCCCPLCGAPALTESGEPLRAEAT